MHKQLINLLLKIKQSNTLHRYREKVLNFWHVLVKQYTPLLYKKGNQLWKKFQSIKDKKIKNAIVVSLLLVLWMLSGLVSCQHQNTQPINKQKVATTYVKPYNEPVYFNISGTIDAKEKVSLHSHVNGEVEEILAKDGQVLHKGDPIVRINPRGKQFELKSAEAKLRAAEKEYKAAKELMDAKLGSSVHLANSQAKYDAALSALNQISNEMGHTIIRAPFDGFIDKINVHVGEVVSNGMLNGAREIGLFVADNHLMAVGYISQKQLQKLNQESKVMVTDGLIAKEGNIAFVSAVADNITKTYRIEVALPAADLQVGQIVKIKIPTQTKDTIVAIPKSATSLDANGSLIVKLIKSEMVVESKSIEIAGENAASFLVIGIAPGAQLITRGAQFVKDGEIVEAITENG